MATECTQEGWRREESEVILMFIDGDRFNGAVMQRGTQREGKRLCMGPFGCVCRRTFIGTGVGGRI